MSTLPRSQSGAVSERSVAIPFNTPILTGARIRPLGGGATELVVPNPSGGHGFYVFDIKATRDFCQLSIHDEMLLQGLLKAPVLTPAVVRQTAREVALTGAAGRELARAAARANDDDTQRIGLANFLLIIKLAKRNAGEPVDLKRLNLGDPGLHKQLRAEIRTLAPDIGMQPADIYTALTHISVHAASIGFATGEIASEHQATLHGIEKLIHSLSEWGRLERGEAKEIADRVLQAAFTTFEQTSPVVKEAQQEIENVMRLLAKWRTEHEVLLDRFAFCDWMLHGWETICSLWETVAKDGRAAQRLALLKMDELLPFTKEELEQGRMRIKNAQSTEARKKWVKLYEDWKTGVRVIDFVARMEALRAQTI